MNDIERYGLRPNVAAALQADVGGSDERTSLPDLLHVLRKRRGTILGLTVGTFALTAALTMLQSPVYQAKSKLLVQTKQPGFRAADPNMPLIGDMLSGLTSARSIGTEIEVLQSNTLVDRAIVEADSAKIQRLRARIGARERERATVARTDETEDVPARLVELDALDRQDQAAIEAEANRMLEARRRILTDPDANQPRDPKLQVDSPKDTDVITLKAEDRSPDRAQDFVNSLTVNYLDQNRRLNSASARRARQFVGQRLEQLRRELTRAEMDLTRFKERTRSADLSEETKQEITRLADIGTQQHLAQTEEKGLADSVAILRKQLASTPASVQSSVVNVPNPVVGELEKQVAGLEVQKAGLLKEYTPDSAEVRQVEAQIREAQARIGEQERRLIGESAKTLNPIHQELL
jgi:uncharacterized protein involved in exopolysaccharide biosynthesis